jgi:hypothetical protein
MKDHTREDSAHGDGRRRATTAAAARDGVDPTVIRWFLRLMPGERLDALQRNVDAVLELRRGTPAP